MSLAVSLGSAAKCEVWSLEWRVWSGVEWNGKRVRGNQDKRVNCGV